MGCIALRQGYGRFAEYWRNHDDAESIEEIFSRRERGPFGLRNRLESSKLRP
jgi:hypothetical protein